jgi:ATPase subunit of ABC transporter with duplicated ATPase domains
VPFGPLEPPAGCSVEDVVERRRVELQTFDMDPRLIESSGYGTDPGSTTRQSYRDVVRRVRGRFTEFDQKRLHRDLVLPGGDRDAEGGLPDLRLQARRGAFCNDVSVVDDRDAARQLVGFLHVLRGQEHGCAGLTVQLSHLIPQCHARVRIEPGCRLVEKEHLRFVYKRKCKVEASPHASRVSPDSAVGSRREPYRPQQDVAALATLGLVDSVQDRLKTEQLSARHKRIDCGVLKSDADRAPDSIGFVHHVVPRDPRTPGRRPEQRGEHSNRGRLAGAVGSEEAENFPSRKLEIDAGNGLDVAEAANEGLGHHGLFHVLIGHRRSLSSGSGQQCEQIGRFDYSGAEVSGRRQTERKPCRNIEMQPSVGRALAEILVAIIEVTELEYALPGGRVLFDDVSFRVGNKMHVALVGANGVGKTTLLRLIAGEDSPRAGWIRADGRILVMRQFVGSLGSETTVKDFLLELSTEEVRRAAEEVRETELTTLSAGDSRRLDRYALALASWGEVGGYEAEVLWDTCTTAALGKSFDEVSDRSIHSLSGGEQKRLALESLFRSDAQILLLDEPDNFLDIAGKRWLEGTMNASKKTILYVSHDRALLANTAHRVVTLEGRGAWTHPESFATYSEERERRIERIDEELRRYNDEHRRLVASMKEFKRRAAISDAFASRAKASVTKVERFERTVPRPKRPSDQNIRMDLTGGRTGKLALRTRGLGFPEVVRPFSTELYFGERVGVVGPNGSGKSHFLHLLVREDLRHVGEYKLGARVRPRLFSQLHDRPDIEDVPILDVMMARGFDRSKAMSSLKRYELHGAATLPFTVLSGGQQARFQLLLIEKDSPTMLLLDEPTDNLDVASAEALEEGLMNYEGTVVAVTHDRWFMLLMDRFLVFNADGSVTEATESPYLQ